MACGHVLQGLWSVGLCECVSVWGLGPSGLLVRGSPGLWAYVSVNLWVRDFMDLWVLIFRKRWAESLPLVAARIRKEENKSVFLIPISLFLSYIY